MKSKPAFEIFFTILNLVLISLFKPFNPSSLQSKAGSQTLALIKKFVVILRNTTNNRRSGKSN